MSPKRVKKRVEFDLEGAACLIRVYTDGSSLIRVDHPSNDPMVEAVIAGRIVQRAADVFAQRGLEIGKYGPLRWRSDPDGTPPQR